MHLKTGEHIVTNLEFPRYDFYSYTAYGNFWFNPHWMFQVFIYLLHRIGGFGGIIVVKTLAILASFVIVFRIGYRRENYLTSLVFLLMVVLASKDRFSERPEFVSFILLSIYLALLYEYRERKTRWIWLLPFLQAVWTNLHVFSFVGLGIVFIYLLADLIAAKIVLPLEWNKVPAILRGRDYLTLVKVFVLALIFSLANPYGIKIFSLPFYLLGFMANHRDILVGGISELIPPFDRTGLFAPGYFYYKVLIFATVLSFILRFRHLDLAQLLLCTAFLYLSLTAVRNIMLFCLVAYSVVIQNTSDIFLRIYRHTVSRPLRILKKLLAVVMAFYIFYNVFLFSRDNLTFNYYVEGKLEKRFGLSVSSFFPENALDFILSQNIQGNVFNSFGFGSYFVYRAFPERKVFVDGRTSVYGDDFLRYYADLHFYPAVFDNLIKTYKIDYFLLNINEGGVFRRLYLDRDNWCLVFFDLNGAVFVRNSPENKTLIEKYEVDLEKLPLDRENGYSRYRRRPYPISCFIKGEAFYNLGLNRRAEAEYRLGLRVNPDVAGLYNNIGIIYQDEGRIEEAVELYKKALQLDPHLINATINLSSIYQSKGELNKALELYKKVLPPFNMPNSIVYNHLGELYRQKGLLRKALESYNRALAIEPFRYEFHYNRGLVFTDMGQIQKALLCFRKAKELNPESAIIYNNIGACYMTLKKYELAQQEFKQALEIDPDLAEAQSNLEKLRKLIAEETETKSK
jgi:tetratricopeptide (TPR) repeat protein